MRETGWRPRDGFRNRPGRAPSTGIAPTRPGWRACAAANTATYYERNYGEPSWWHKSGQRAGEGLASLGLHQRPRATASPAPMPERPLRCAWRLKPHRWRSRSGGLARYTGELSLALARYLPDDEFFLVSDQPFAMPRGAPPNLEAGRRPAQRHRAPLVAVGPGRGNWTAWAPSVVHGPDFAVPYLPRRPSVLTLHDLSPWMDPAWHHARRRVARRTPLLVGDGIGHHGGDPQRGGAQAGDGTLPPAAGARGGRAGSRRGLAASGRRRSARDALLSLCLGTLEPRKNLPALVEAWREVRRRHHSRPGAGRAAPSRLPAAGRGAGSADCWARCPDERARRSTPAGRWRSSTRRFTKVSGCRCWKPCSAARA